MYVFLVYVLWLGVNSILTEPIKLIPRIIGGYDCYTKDYPFVVSIRFKNDWRKHICGGTLIKRDWVLTAAHCVRFGSAKPGEFVVILYTSSSRIYGEESKNVKSIHVHPKVNIKPYHNDVAVLHLKLPFMKKLELVRLPPSAIDGDISSVCKEILMMGWGATVKWDPILQTMSSILRNAFDGQLRCVMLPTLSTDACKSYTNSMDENTFCTMYRSGGKDSCLGDSGGPVMCNGIQYGIISHAYGCALENEPSFNVRIDRMLEFIEGVMLKNGEGRNVGLSCSLFVILPYMI